MGLLNVKDLKSGYNKVSILHGINFEVAQSEVVSVIGRNGVGKSTLMKTLIGLIPVKEGSIILQGKDITKIDANKRARLGLAYVPQGHGVFPFLSVEENLKMGQMVNANQQKIDNIERVYHYFPKLKDRRKQLAGTMSGGEQAMLSIGRALSGNPSILLFDEPSEGVQPNVIDLIGEIINQISHELNLTVLMVEQNMALMQQISQRAYVINKGVITHSLNRSELNDNEIVKGYLSI